MPTGWGGAGKAKEKLSPVEDWGLSSKTPAARAVHCDPVAALGGEKTPGNEAARYRNRWLFTPATVLSAVDPEAGVVLIRTGGGEVHRVKGEDLEDVNPQALLGLPDAMSVSNITEASLLHTIRERYSREEMYTRIGPVLVSVNPYKWIAGLYDDEMIIRYHGKADLVESGILAPHLFGVADHAYSQLVRGHVDAEAETETEVETRKLRASNQSIIISGESGSGKTEAMKIIIHYFARITSANAENCGNVDAPASTEEAPARTLGKKSLSRKMSVRLNVGELETRLLSCSPLLESFGNAVTLKNDNASRYGNFTKIQFDKRGKILGAQIQNYLLEKTRIVDRAKCERSYHVFYQMLAGASNALKKELRLEKGVAGFDCLRGSSIKEGDAQEFEHTKECLTNIGIQPEGETGGDEHGQKEIFTLVAAVMHLLNVGFQKVAGQEGDACMIDEKTRGSLNIAGELLGVDADALEKAMVSKTMAVPSIVSTVQRTVDQAYDKAAALGKALYSQLFLWLVAKLNVTISAPHSDVWGFIGVLDMYGFETLKTNSFEQLLINYANEHLQRHFNQYMFEVEQIDYKKEQIGWSYIPFTDNKACLELIGGEGGLLSLLDNSQRFEAKEANQHFLSSFKQSFGPSRGSGWGGARRRLLKLSSFFSIETPARRSAGGRGHPHSVLPRFNKDNEDSSFGIKHYAGEVMYSVSKFSQKSRENLTADVKDLMATSSRRLVLNVFRIGVEGTETDGDGDDEAPCTAEGYGRGRGGASGRTMRSKSVGIQFQESVDDLMGTISVTQPRFIRRIKPNSDKETRFDGEDLLLQLRYSGIMDIIRIQQQEQEEAPATNLRATAAAVPGLSPQSGGNVDQPLLRRPRGGSIGGPTRDSCSGSNGQEWWAVLVHPTGDERVPQALMSHGLPLPQRRSIWGTWAARCVHAEARVTSNLVAQSSTTRLITEDVKRTKIEHPLFSAGGQGMDMLKRVLLRCAELGAVEEVGYIQSMSHVAGFLLVTIADAVFAERDCATNGGTAAPGTSAGGDRGAEATPLEVIETECVQGMLGMVAMQGGILSKDLCGVHANTELLGELMSKFSPEIMDHLREINVDLILLTPRWFISIYTGSMTSHTLIARIWDLYLWYGRRGPAVLVWVALSLLHGCRRQILNSTSLPAAVKTVHRHAEGCTTFEDLVRHAPLDLNQVVAAWDGRNRRIARPESAPTNGEGGDTTISSPGRSPLHSGDVGWRPLRRWRAKFRGWMEWLRSS